MNPENKLPARPRFSWDMRTAPWTDGKGKQEEYKEAVELWCAFHDALDEKCPNKLQKGVRLIILRSQLFGLAKDLGKKIDMKTVKSDGGPAAIVKAVYKRDTLSCVCDVYND